jgi:hypothetical protein
MGVLSLGLGCVLAGVGKIAIFHALQPTTTMRGGWDIVFSGIFISAGTEGFNSLLKFVGYKKDAAKNDSEAKALGLSEQRRALGNPQR